MKIVDLNVLIYAVNEDSAQHAAMRDWWHEALNGDESIGIPWVVLLGFLRLTTNPRIFPRPMSCDDAIELIDEWLERPMVSVPTEKDDHWKVLARLLGESGAAGNLTTDAHIAALAMTRDATLVSCDRDFARFAGLRYRNPLR